MDPVTLSLAMSAAQGLYGVGQRASAARRRKRAMENLRYDIPDATLQQVNLSRERASRSGLPGEDITRARLESDMAGSLRRGESVAETASDVLGLYSQMFGKKADTERQLLEAGAQYKSQNEMELMRSLGLLAEAEGQQFYYNEYVPYLTEMGYAGEQSAGGAANIAAGLQGAYSTWENQWMMDEYSKMFGGQGQPGMDVQTQLSRDSLKSREPLMMTDAGSSPEFTPPQYQTPVSPWVKPRSEMSTAPFQGTAGSVTQSVPGSPSRSWIAGQGSSGWQDLPEWQKQNPVSYPAHWLKYFNR